MRTRSFRRFSGITPLILAAGLMACGSQNDNPVSPSFVNVKGGIVPFASTSTTWDFAALIGTANGCQDWGTQKTATNGSFGSVNLTSGNVTGATTVTSKGLELAPGSTERGLGLAIGGPCAGEEVGEPSDGYLFVDFTNVLPANSKLEQIDIGSIQSALGPEGWEVWYSTTGKGDGTTGYQLLSRGVGDGTNNPGDNVIITVDPALPITNLVLRFQKNLTQGDPTTGNDYVVKSVVTTSTTDESFDGRMTGGGVKATGDNGEIVTFGLTLHCDIILSNNLEINWQGHKWHLTKPITKAICTDDPNIAPPPPVAPIDTFEGEGFGELDGVGNSKVVFKFQDAGEPGSDDTVEITIFEPGSSTVALHITSQKLSVGNWQMHYDQPHGQKP
jgi:hypothetical protein